MRGRAAVRYRGRSGGVSKVAGSLRGTLHAAVTFIDRRLRNGGRRDCFAQAVSTGFI
jgi:hypothetical protein